MTGIEYGETVYLEVGLRMQIPHVFVLQSCDPGGGCGVMAPTNNNTTTHPGGGHSGQAAVIHIPQTTDVTDTSYGS